MEGLHPLSGKFRATADYAEAKRNFGGGWGTSRLDEDGSAIPGSATVATSGMSEAGSSRSVGENVALQVPSHGIPIVAQGPKAITRGLRLHTELPQESSGSSLVYSAYGPVVHIRLPSIGEITSRPFPP